MDNPVLRGVLRGEEMISSPLDLSAKIKSIASHLLHTLADTDPWQIEFSSSFLSVCRQDEELGESIASFEDLQDSLDTEEFKQCLVSIINEGVPSTLSRYYRDPRVINFFSLASESTVHGEMLSLALGSSYGSPDSLYFRPGYADNVDVACKLLTHAVDVGLLYRGNWKPSPQQRFFGLNSRFGCEMANLTSNPSTPSRGGFDEISCQSVLFQYTGNKEGIYLFFGW